MANSGVSELDWLLDDLVKRVAGADRAVVLSSDGLRSQWGLEALGGLLGREPAVVAAALLRDNARGTDDATVVVVQDRRASSA